MGSLTDLAVDTSALFAICAVSNAPYLLSSYVWQDPCFIFQYLHSIKQVCKSIQRVTKAYPAPFFVLFLWLGDRMLRNLGKLKFRGVFLWGMLSDNKVIWNMFKLAKYGGMGSFASKFVSESEEKNDYLNYSRAFTTSLEEIVRFNKM